MMGQRPLALALVCLLLGLASCSARWVSSTCTAPAARFCDSYLWGAAVESSQTPFYDEMHFMEGGSGTLAFADIFGTGKLDLLAAVRSLTSCRPSSFAALPRALSGSLATAIPTCGRTVSARLLSLPTLKLLPPEAEIHT